MGMYTTLYFKVKVKKEYRDFVMLEVFDGDWDNFSLYESIQKSKLKFAIEEYSNDPRAGFIPKGVVMLPTKMGSDNINRYDPRYDIWEVHCSLKNYDETIELFFDFFADMVDELRDCYTVVEDTGGDCMYTYQLVDADPKDYYTIDGKVKRKTQGKRIVIESMKGHNTKYGVL